MTNRAVIGVACRAGEERWAREFFELFKTPWEFYRRGSSYSAVVSTDVSLTDIRARLLVLYSPKPGSDTAEESTKSENTYLRYKDVIFPIYGKLLIFDTAAPLVRVAGNRSAAAAVTETQHDGMKVLRVGYDLFGEVRFLLSTGQPPSNALIPTLDIHISMLRTWILEAGIPVVEIPPVPAGFESMACLTHDVDFLRIRNQKFNHVLWGFLYRATAGSLLKLLQRRTSWGDFLKNLKAAMLLPAVHLGLCKDFWFEDFERFTSLERDLKATYFFIPFKNRPGDKGHRPLSKKRAAFYDVRDERPLLQELASEGHEIGVHGIDAWHDADKGREERCRLAEATGHLEVGVRVHWLCFDAASPRVLEEAGFHYDSTCGYNETVGYRAGTSQVFQPEEAASLLELPLHIQDTALFSPRRLGLDDSAAWKPCEILLNNATTHGGVLTILWHTRSLAPERLWGNLYVRLLKALRTRSVWFATAGNIVDWFRSRRAVSFRSVQLSEGHVHLEMRRDGCANGSNSPALMIRINVPPTTPDAAPDNRGRVIDVPWMGDPVLDVPLAQLGVQDGAHMHGRV